MEMLQKVISETPALVLRAARATGRDADEEIMFSDLRDAEIGSEWQASGGGSLFSEYQRATLIFRNERIAGVVVERYHAANGEETCTQILQAFSLER